MRNTFLLILIFLVCLKSYSQTITCKEILFDIRNNGELVNRINCQGSSMLVKVEYYTLKGTGFVVAYFKENNNDYTGQPYVFCGISDILWRRFKSEGSFNSYGKSFNSYIRSFKCNCR